jgi:hypothetical protein
VTGIDPGLYVLEGDALRVIETGDEAAVRARAQMLCCSQPLGGDSAFTMFHCVDLGAVRSAGGDRGYFSSQFEAGVASGRLQLAAFARGSGATGLTFFDDAVTAAFGDGYDCMLVTAVGAPDYQPAAGGRPGQVAELGSYESLMSKVMEQIRAASAP